MGKACTIIDSCTWISITNILILIVRINYRKGSTIITINRMRNFLVTNSNISLRKCNVVKTLSIKNILNLNRHILIFPNF